MAEKIKELSQSKKMARIIRIIAVLVMVLVVGLFIYELVSNFIPELIPLLEDGSHEEIEAYLRQAGRRGIVMLVALQVIQTITIVFPGIPIYVASGIVYGRIQGTIICYITYIVSNSAIFLFSRKMGEVSDLLFAGSQKSHEQEDYASGLLSKAKHPARVVAALCVIPVIPNGLIPHIAAKTNITFKKFILAVCVGCLPGIFLFVCCGSWILDGHFVLLMVMCIAALACMMIFFVFKKQIFNLMQKFSPKEESLEG